MFPVVLKSIELYCRLCIRVVLSCVYLEDVPQPTAQIPKVWWALCDVDIYKDFFFFFFTPELQGIEAKLCFSWIIWFEMNISEFRPISIFGWPAQI